MRQSCQRGGDLVISNGRIFLAFFVGNRGREEEEEVEGGGGGGEMEEERERERNEGIIWKFGGSNSRELP